MKMPQCKRGSFRLCYNDCVTCVCHSEIRLIVVKETTFTVSSVSLFLPVLPDTSLGALKFVKPYCQPLVPTDHKDIKFNIFSGCYFFHDSHKSLCLSRLSACLGHWK